MTELVSYPANDVYFIARKSFTEICDGNGKAGLLLGYFYYWHKVKVQQNVKSEVINDVAEMHGDKPTQDVSHLQWHTTEQIYEDLMGLIGKKSILPLRRFLKEKGFISEHRNPNPKYHFDKTIYYEVHVDKIQEALDELKMKQIKAVRMEKLIKRNNEKLENKTEIKTETKIDNIKEETVNNTNNTNVEEHVEESPILEVVKTKKYSSMFEDIWSFYNENKPNPGSKAQAAERYNKSKFKKYPINVQKKIIKLYRADVSDIKYTKHLSTFLSQQVFETYAPKPVKIIDNEGITWEGYFFDETKEFFFYDKRTNNWGSMRVNSKDELVKEGRFIEL